MKVFTRTAGLVRSVVDLVRRGHFRLLAAHTLRFLGLRGLLSRMTCSVCVPGVSHSPIRLFVEPGDLISDDLCRYRQWEPVLTREVLAHVRPGAILVDAGANLGYYSLLWVAAGGAQAFAFEPSPSVVPKLFRNVELNGFADRIHVSEFALSNAAGSVQFDPRDARQTGWGGIEPGASHGLTVNAERLDDALASVRYIDVLKVDTEGWDTRVLQGAERLLRDRRIGAVYYEQLRDRMKQFGMHEGEAQAFLESCGYRVRRLGGGADDDVTQWEALPARVSDLCAVMPLS